MATTSFLRYDLQCTSFLRYSLQCTSFLRYGHHIVPMLRPAVYIVPTLWHRSYVTASSVHRSYVTATSLHRSYVMATRVHRSYVMATSVHRSWARRRVSLSIQQRNTNPQLLNELLALSVREKRTPKEAWLQNSLHCQVAQLQTARGFLFPSQRNKRTRLCKVR